MPVKQLDNDGWPMDRPDPDWLDPPRSCGHEWRNNDFICFECLERRFSRLKEAAVALLAANHCPCGDVGFTARQTDDFGNAEQEQCEFCHSDPTSRFNAANQLRTVLSENDQ
jgi:hypothetical protein